MINRARSRPLHITVKDRNLLQLIEGRRNISAFDILLEENDYRRSWQDGATQYLTGTFPALDTLSLCSHHQAFLADFLTLDAPRLRSVRLFNWLPIWHLPFMQNLTSLSVVIDAVGFDRHSPDQPPKLSDVLRRNPSLEKLQLEGVIWRRDLDLPEIGSSELLQLRHLRHLELKDDVALIDRFLRVLDLPDLESLTIRAELCTENATPELVALCDALHRLMCTGQWMTLRLLSWELGPTSKVEVRNERGQIFSFAAIEDMHPSEMKMFSKTLILSLPLIHLKILQVHISDPSSKPLLPLWMALSTLPELATIEFKGSGCRAFEGLLNALLPTFTLPGLKKQCEPFPALQQLTLSGLKMYRKVADNSSLFWQLVSFLISRIQRGIPVPEVLLVKCSFATPLHQLKETKHVRIKEPRIILPYYRRYGSKRRGELGLFFSSLWCTYSLAF